MTIKFDRSQVSGILVTCTECPYWFAFHFNPDAAYAAGEGHAERVHDVDPRTASQARRRRDSRLRHAAGS